MSSEEGQPSRESGKEPELGAKTGHGTHHHTAQTSGHKHVPANTKGSHETDVGLLYRAEEKLGMHPKERAMENNAKNQPTNKETQL